jgi:hypothetical protein
MKLMRIFHRTTHDAAADIRIMGFYDSTNTYMASHEHTGVWVSDQPLDINEGADGDTLLTLKIPVDLFVRYEWVEEGKGYREALVPADELNPHGQPRIVRWNAEDRWLTLRGRKRMETPHDETP